MLGLISRNRPLMSSPVLFSSLDDPGAWNLPISDLYRPRFLTNGSLNDAVKLMTYGEARAKISTLTLVLNSWISIVVQCAITHSFLTDIPALPKSARSMMLCGE